VDFNARASQAPLYVEDFPHLQTPLVQRELSARRLSGQGIPRCYIGEESSLSGSGTAAWLICTPRQEEVPLDIPQDNCSLAYGTPRQASTTGYTPRHSCVTFGTAWGCQCTLMVQDALCTLYLWIQHITTLSSATNAGTVISAMILSGTALLSMPIRGPWWPRWRPWD
jgi:hypothetical protein